MPLGRHALLFRRTLLAGAGFALVSRRVQALQTPALYGITSLIDGTAMVPIPAGEFLMGTNESTEDEGPPHRVRITHPFEMGKFEVTQAQWEVVVGEAHPKPGVDLVNAQGAKVSRTPSHFKGGSLPVDSVSWDDVQLFLKRLNARDAGHAYRLPTEAEWEYACRAGKPLSPSAPRAWSKSNANERTHSVGQKEPNEWGLFDMEGNVAEWVEDWYGYDYYAQSSADDPRGPRTGSYRVFRGGSWLDDDKRCAATHRGFDFPINRFYNVGFRVVRTPA